MAEEIKSIFKSRNYWMAFAISFLTLLGYSLSSWLNAVSVGESMEYRESALSLSVGGIFFGGFMLLFPFCASVAHATSQVDELQSGMARWRVMRGSVARYVGVKAAASMLAAFRSGILVSAILRTSSLLMVATLVLLGTPEPDSMLQAFLMSTAAGGVLVMKVKERSA